jgi:hypothetical protein
MVTDELAVSQPVHCVAPGQLRRVISRLDDPSAEAALMRARTFYCVSSPQVFVERIAAISGHDIVRPPVGTLLVVLELPNLDHVNSCTVLVGGRRLHVRTDVLCELTVPVP